MISIIIPAYNAGGTILKTIKSIYGSSGLGGYSKEIIVVDDKSIDETLDLVHKNFPKVKLYCLETHGGASAARNKGIKLSKGDTLLFIDSDAWLDKLCIGALAKGIRDDIDITFPKITYGKGKLLYPVFENEKGFPAISCCFMIKKKSIGKLDEYFDEEYGTYLEDADFFIRCRLARLKARYIEDAFVIHANKDAEMDYSGRYYLEAKNIVYGIAKLGKLEKKSGLHNPFTIASLFSAFACGLLNFAWFNWQGYSRKSGAIDKLRRKNKIFQGNSLKSTMLFSKAILYNFKTIKNTMEKRDSVRKFYNSIKN